MENTLVREIITIDEELCDGCGVCVPNCPEGALQVIDGKARLVGELLCDGLGACVGRCPKEAMTVERREAEPYEEARVMANVVPQGVNTIVAHLEHLRHSGASEYLSEAMEYISTNDFPGQAEVLGRLADAETEGSENGGSPQTPVATQSIQHSHGAGPTIPHACPGSREMSFAPGEATHGPTPVASTPPAHSALTQWPVQMHLINPKAPYFQGCDLLMAADCTAFAFGGFHSQLLSGRKLTIACPKLDQGAEVYIEKLTALIDEAQINTLTVAIMEVPCCGGLVQMAQMATEGAERKVPIKQIVVGISGDILDETWL